MSKRIGVGDGGRKGKQSNPNALSIGALEPNSHKRSVNYAQ